MWNLQIRGKMMQLLLVCVYHRGPPPRSDAGQTLSLLMMGNKKSLAINSLLLSLLCWKSAMRSRARKTITGKTDMKRTCHGLTAFTSVSLWFTTGIPNRDWMNQFLLLHSFLYSAPDPHGGSMLWRVAKLLAELLWTYIKILLCYSLMYNLG